MTSRIGKKPLTIPDGVEVNFDSKKVIVKGSKGSLDCDIPECIDVKIEDKVLTVVPKDSEKQTLAFHGLIRSLLGNMIVGVSEGFTKELEIIGTGYRAALKGADLDLSLGFSHQVIVKAKEGIQFALDGQNKIIVSGIDKQKVGEVAADIRKLRPPEPYKGKGIRYVGEHIIRKEGKAGA